MAPAVLVTLGVLILMGNLSVIDFHKSFPIMLIVIGVILVLQRTSSTEGHIPNGYMEPLAPPPPTQPPSDIPPDIPGPGAQGVHNG
jgi:hypothetical protein